MTGVPPSAEGVFHCNAMILPVVSCALFARFSGGLGIVKIMAPFPAVEYYDIP